MSGKGEWVNLRFPNAFAHPFSFQGRDGGTRERMLVVFRQINLRVVTS